MTQHTPGPWKADAKRQGAILVDRSVRVDNGNGFTVCSIADWPDDETATANQNLIAAAPELLEAVELCCTIFNVLLNQKEDFNLGGISSQIEQARDNARSKLAKARGEVSQ